MGWWFHNVDAYNVNTLLKMSVFVPQTFISSYIKAYTNNINDLYKIMFKSYPHLSQLEFFYLQLL